MKRILLGATALLLMGSSASLAQAAAPPISQSVAICDGVTQTNCLKVNSDGSINVVGGGGGSNAAAGTTGVAPPGSASYTGFQNAGGNLVGVSPANPLPISGTITASLGAFAPTASTVALTATTTSSNAAISGTGTILFANNGTATVYVKFGTSNAVTAAATDTPVPAGQTIAFANGSNTYIAVLAASGSNPVMATPGTGLPALANSGGGSTSLTNYALETGGNLATIVTNTSGLFKAGQSIGNTSFLDPSAILGTATITSSTTTSLGSTAGYRSVSVDVSGTFVSTFFFAEGQGGCVTNLRALTAVQNGSAYGTLAPVNSTNQASSAGSYRLSIDPGQTACIVTTYTSGSLVAQANGGGAWQALPYTYVSNFPTTQGVNNAQIAGTAVSVNTGATDAGTQRVVLAATQPTLTAQGLGSAGTPSGGVLSVQGVSGGTPVPISGSFTASAPSDAIPASATLSGATYNSGTGALTFTAINQTAIIDTNGQRLGFSVTTAGAETLAAYTSESPTGPFAVAGSGEFICANTVGTTTSALTQSLATAATECYVGGQAGRYVQLIDTAYTATATLNLMLHQVPVSSKQVFVANNSGVAIGLGGNAASSALNGTNVGSTTLSVHQVPTSAAGVAIAPVTSTTATGLLGKASAANDYGYAFAEGATAGYFCRLNLAAVPTSGATITPTMPCIPLAANGYVEFTANAPIRWSVGEVVVSTSSTTTYTPVTPAGMALLVE